MFQNRQFIGLEKRLSWKEKVHKKKHAGGRPSKVSIRQQSLYALRKEEGHFSINRLM